MSDAQDNSGTTAGASGVLGAPTEDEPMHDPCAYGGPSALAERVRRLRGAALSAIERRERLPHPLFWSLFHSEVGELRRQRARAREEQRVRILGES